jgi:hypothetical protein
MKCWQQVFCCFRVGTDKVISWIQCVVQVLAEAAMIANIPANINRKDLHSKNGTIGTMICSTISLMSLLKSFIY